jgi:hypothetical protein
MSLSSACISASLIPHVASELTPTTAACAGASLIHQTAMSAQSADVSHVKRRNSAIAADKPAYPFLTSPPAWSGGWV